ncbi:hypothetical protein [Alkalinema sp. FACHB-956]|uniref:hypothetical protein n=1 Tax=Alkalinema sp. FACHB-956 TaxID=2692768 RepID=UPI001684C131|nr:hypothetical protein [Alkalinema sp. FACHB-956]MBD2325352.1 hypothetical protein [Alkalinema sp. FACHB-956]
MRSSPPPPLQSSPRSVVIKTQTLRPFIWLGLLLLAGLTRPVLLSQAVPMVQLSAQTTQPQALAGARSQQRQQQERQVRPDNYDLARYPVDDRNAKHWKNLLWTTAIVEPKQPFVAQAMERILAMTRQPNLSNAQMRTIDMALQVGTQLYAADPRTYSNLTGQLRATIEQSKDPQWVAMAIAALANGNRTTKTNLSTQEIQQLSQRIQQRFPNWQTQPYLYTTLQDIATAFNPPAAPPLKDLLQWQAQPGEMQAYVLCNVDRHALCRMVLKDDRGQWVREKGQLWSVPLLLRSVHGLSWNFVRGNTPQGLYRIDSTTPQPDDLFFRAYGQFSLVNLFVPFEAGTTAMAGFSGSPADYQALFPPSWQNHWGLQQSYWAGKLGRSLFRIHGTGDAPDFFSGKQRNPASANWNPTIGCLSALELYSETGKLLQADMPQILEKLQSASSDSLQGYLVVVDLAQTPGTAIELEDIVAAIN